MGSEQRPLRTWQKTTTPPLPPLFARRSSRLEEWASPRMPPNARKPPAANWETWSVADSRIAAATKAVKVDPLEAAANASTPPRPPAAAAAIESRQQREIFFLTSDQAASKVERDSGASRQNERSGSADRHDVARPRTANCRHLTTLLTPPTPPIQPRYAERDARAAGARVEFGETTWLPQTTTTPPLPPLYAELGVLA